MDEERRTKIATALHGFRHIVSQHNIAMLRALVDSLEAKPTPPKWPASLAQQKRMKVLRHQLQGAVPASVTSPRDLLSEDLRPELTRLCNLDGVDHKPVDPQKRADYFSAIQTRISEKSVVMTEFPPADLEYLCTLVSGVTGPGLPLHREQKQFHFVSPLEDEVLEYMTENVVVPNRDDEEGYNELTYVWEDWEIAVAFKIGGGPRSWGGSYALLCRNEDNDERKWRYGVHDEEWESGIYDSVEEFLEFYAHFTEQTEEDITRGVEGMSEI
ncbi:hypothetical protein LTR36_005749 [Oleoguttula mirabilis]|uniref:Knr4/Smi1-like domain-containing protein n=1 Tax=Oleoguttula mirabilis TaxID=1507867 RepID=A0AAV9JDH3_9PEZI|nr:hypothetical protein LTR36_005749 [Oleoguttula mirabilis]